MELTNKLINLLTQYIEEFRQLRDRYKNLMTNQSLYEELLTALNVVDPEENRLFIPILLNCIYGDNIYVDEYYNACLQSNKKEVLAQFAQKINRDYLKFKEEKELLKKRIDKNYWLYKSAKTVRICLYNQRRIPNSKNDVYNIQKILSYYENAGIISTKEEILLINEIELHNRRLAAQRGDAKEQEYTDILYNGIPNILSIGFEQFESIEVSSSRKKTLDTLIKELTNIIKDIEAEDLEDILNSYQKYNLDTKEYRYILIETLDYLLEELLALYDLLIDKEVYTNRRDRVDAVKDYYITLEKYIIIRNYHEKLIEKVVQNITPVIPTQEDNQLPVIKRLIYARSNVNVTKTRLISDMSDIPEEYYDTVYTLLEDFKTGQNANKEIKTLSSSHKTRKCFELKYDQVRIILTHVKDDMYAVLGAFVKKTDNDIDRYVTMAERAVPKVNTPEQLRMELELSEQAEKELSELVKTKGRKGTR